MKVLTENEVETIEKIISKGYNPHQNSEFICKIKGREGLYVGYSEGWNMLFKPFEGNLDSIIQMHKKQQKAASIRQWLRNNIKRTEVSGVYVQPSIICIAQNLLERDSGRFEHTQFKTCYDCNGPSWSHSSWEEWRGSATFVIDIKKMSIMKEKLKEYSTISKEMGW